MNEKIPLTDEQKIQCQDIATEQVNVAAMHEQIARELDEPSDGFEPVSIWLVAVFGIILFWSGWYLSTYSGGWRSDILNEDPSARMTGNAGPPKPLDPLKIGEGLFIANCTACHGVTGAGQPGAFPPLAGSEFVKANPAGIQHIVMHGLQGKLIVDGQEFNGAMPPFGAVLNDEKLAAVLTYIRHAWGNEQSAVTPEEVAATRKETADRKTPYNQAEIEAIIKAATEKAGASSEEAPAKDSAAPAATAPAEQK